MVAYVPGGLSWEENRYEEIAAFVQKAVNRGIPVAAICVATIFMGKMGTCLRKWLSTVGL